MSEQDATPRGRVDAAIPEHLRAQVRVAAEWRVVKACKNVTVPQEVDAVREAVHTLDGFDRDELPAATLIDLGKEAIDWWMPTARPHTTEQFRELLDDLDLIRDLVRMVGRLSSSASAEN